MLYEPTWVQRGGGGRLGVMGAPPGGPALALVLDALQQRGVDVVISLLEPFEEDVLGLADAGEVARAVGLELYAFPIAERGVPESDDEAAALVRFLCDALDGGSTVVLLGSAGHGRGPLVAGAVLLGGGVPLDEVLRRLEEAIGWTAPDASAQRQWLSDRASGGGRGETG